MRVLLDECLPRKLKNDLPGHAARTVPEMGWAGKKNGELLQLAAPTV
jgi:predicted nuclease of predicted toxin-antitoxin system